MAEPGANVFGGIGLAMGILAMFTWCCCPIFAVPGVACSIVALVQISNDPGRYTGRSPAVAGLILSLVALGVFIFLHLTGVSFGEFLEGFATD